MSDRFNSSHSFQGACELRVFALTTPARREKSGVLGLLSRLRIKVAAATFRGDKAAVRSAFELAL